jgi:hypothetical protein
MNKSGLVVLLVVLLLMPLQSVLAADANTAVALERKIVQLDAKTTNGVLISIPRTALIQRGGIPGVFVVENNEARFRMVRPGKTRAKQVEILSGLFGNEALLIDDLDAVHDGSPIKVVSSKTSSKGPGKK